VQGGESGNVMKKLNNGRKEWGKPGKADNKRKNLDSHPMVVKSVHEGYFRERKSNRSGAISWLVERQKILKKRNWHTQGETFERVESD